MLTQTVWTHESFGLPRIQIEDLRVDNPEESAQVIRRVLGGQQGPCRDIVIANVAATLWVANQTHSLLDGVQKASRAIDSGIASGLLKELAEMSNA
jgi:anthranilate phosphoribosyltransferase